MEAIPGLLDYGAVTDIPVVLPFDDFYRQEYPSLVAVATAMTGNRDDAYDAAQDTMVRALLRWGRVSRYQRPAAWCHHVLLNLCRSRWRRSRTERRWRASLRVEEPITAGPSASTIAFWHVVRELPSRPRTVVALHFAGQLTSVEIAELLQVPEGTVRSDLHAARRFVLARLGARDE